MIIIEFPNPNAPVGPKIDARLGPLMARIEREWRQFRPAYYRELEEGGTLRESIRSTALWCLETLNQFETKGLNPDQAREAIQEMINP